MRRLLQVLLTAVALAALGARAGTVVVFAAASLTDCLQEIGRDWQSAGGEEVKYNLAGSSFLSRQIEEGAPADLFFSADDAQMDRLESQGLIETNTRMSRLSNMLVVVVPADSKLGLSSPTDLAKAGRIALADPASVPAGVYAKAWLQRLGLWQAVAAKVIPAGNVRAALAAVASGDVDAAVVYKTDAAISGKVKIAFAARPEDEPAINYPVALLRNAPNPSAARKFLDYLKGDAAGRVFAKFGFIVLPPPP